MLNTKWYLKFFCCLILKFKYFLFFKMREHKKNFGSHLVFSSWFLVDSGSNEST